MSLDAIARGAGVGIGTLYRHFPTRAALVEAVYAAELDELTASTTVLLEEFPPDAALREWVLRYARFAARKRGMIDTLGEGIAAGQISASATRARITAAVRALLAAGVSTGSLRTDVDPEDVTALLLGVFLSTAASRSTSQTERLLDLVIDALQARSAGRSVSAPGW